MLCTTVLIISSSDNGILMTYENNYLGLKLKRKYFMSHLKKIINYTRGLFGSGGDEGVTSSLFWSVDYSPTRKTVTLIFKTKIHVFNFFILILIFNT